MVIPQYQSASSNPTTKEMIGNNLKRLEDFNAKHSQLERSLSRLEMSLLSDETLLEQMKKENLKTMHRLEQLNAKGTNTDNDASGNSI